MDQSKLVFNPKSQRWIKMGGSTHKKLIEKGVMSSDYNNDSRFEDDEDSDISDVAHSDNEESKTVKTKINRKTKTIDHNIPFLPTEMFDEIANNIDIDSIGAFCRSDKRFAKRCKDKNFWAKYIGGDPDNQGNQDYPGNPDQGYQERLHELLIQLAKQGELDLFQFLWSTPLSIQIRDSDGKIVDRELVKEMRTITMAYETAYMNGKKNTAEKIWTNNLSKIEIYYRQKNNNPKIAKVKLGIELDFKLAALSNNLLDYLKVYRKLMRELPGDHEGVMIENSMGKYNLNKDMFKFLLGLFGDSIFINEVAEMQLIEGRFEFVEWMVEEGLIEEKYVTWEYILESSRPDSLTLLQTVKPAIENLTPQFISEHRLRLGDPTLLINYAKEYPEDYDTTIRSFNTLPTKQFVNLYKNTAKTITKNELKRVTKYWKRKGHDYLIKLFTEQIPISG